MDVVFDYHGVLTDRPGDLLELETDHSRHAVVDHVVADLNGKRRPGSPALRPVRRQRLLTCADQREPHVGEHLPFNRPRSTSSP